METYRYRNRTFLIALNLLLVDVVVVIWALAALDFKLFVVAALIGGSLYLSMRTAVMSLKLESRVEEAEKRAEKTEESAKDGE